MLELVCVWGGLTITGGALTDCGRCAVAAAWLVTTSRAEPRRRFFRTDRKTKLSSVKHQPAQQPLGNYVIVLQHKGI